MRTARVPPVAVAVGYKYCFECGNTKSISEFGIATSKPDGLRHICKCCDRARAKRYRKTARGKAVGRAYRESLRRGRRSRTEGKGLHVRPVLA